MDHYFQNKRVAIVCDWIKDWWGAELVLSHLLEIFPQADIFTSVFWQEKNPLFKWRKIVASNIQHIPILNKSHKLALTMRPQAFESFDLSSYDIVVSSSSAESKWVITKPDCLNICYCHTPTRYFWSHYEEYLNMMEFWILNPLGKWLMPKLIKKFRRWDYIAAQRPDYFIANSENTQNRIKKYYNRKSEVIYPAIDIKDFPKIPLSWQERGRGWDNWKKEDYYLAVWRCIPYKKFDLLVEAFNTNGKKLIIATNTDNKLYRKLKKISKSNIKWTLHLPRSKIINLYFRAKCFVFPPEEDFWLVPLEAQSCGTPVIAYWVWGALETVIDGTTWLFFKEQTPKSLNTAINQFESMKFDTKAIRKNAEKFDKTIFQNELREFIDEKLTEHPKLPLSQDQ